MMLLLFSIRLRRYFNRFMHFADCVVWTDVAHVHNCIMFWGDDPRASSRCFYLVRLTIRRTKIQDDL